MNKPTPIMDLWEVRLPQKLWAQVSAIARARGKTFSTISRFCIFALAERSSLRWTKKLRALHAENKAACKAERNLHRHVICFYGEDIRLVRLAALELGITVTAFVRLALRLGLRHLAMEKQSRRYVSDTFLFWRAIKRWAHVKLHATNHLTIPDIRRYLYSSFPPEMRWGMILQQAV